MIWIARKGNPLPYSFDKQLAVRIEHDLHHPWLVQSVANDRPKGILKLSHKAIC